MIIPSFSYGIIAASYPIRGVAAEPLVDKLVVGITKSSGTFNDPGFASMQVGSSTGYFRVDWWDGTWATFGNGDPKTYANNSVPSKVISSPYNTSAQKLVTIRSSNALGDASGRIQAIGSYEELSYFDASGCTGCYFAVISVTDLDQRSTYTTIGIPQSPVMYGLYLFYNDTITSITIPSVCTGLGYIVINAMKNLQSIRLPGIGGSFNGYAYIYNKISSGLDIRGCCLNAAALNQVYTDLKDPAFPQMFQQAVIRVYGNPGITGDNTSIATAKGYVVYGSSSEGSTAP